MGLAELLRKTVLGAALAFSSGYAAGCLPRNEPFKENPPCQEMNYSEQQFTAAFHVAAEKLRKEGYEVRSSLWEDEERFTRLVEAMTDSLGCSLNSASYQALRTEAACTKVKVSPPYNTSIRYCGPGAVSGTGFCERVHPGDCLNTVCYDHDLCYDEMLAKTGNDGICGWSEETGGCDYTFFAGLADCIADLKCGFGCYIVGMIASYLVDTEEEHNQDDDGCQIYETDGSSEDYAALCERLCTRVWKECNGLPEANYNLGNSYNDCIARCPEFIEGVQIYSQTGTMMERLECVASGDYSCQQIGDGDVCNMPEGDLFYCFIEGVPEC